MCNSRCYNADEIISVAENPVSNNFGKNILSGSSLFIIIARKLLNIKHTKTNFQSVKTLLVFLYNQQRFNYYKTPKNFSKKPFNLPTTVCFFKALFAPLENLEIGGNILSRSVPVVFIPPSLNELSMNF